MEYKDSWSVIDSSKMSAYQICPRYFFYRYILGWKGEGKSLNLIFGEAWHRAKEVVMVRGTGDEALADAMSAFLDYYRKWYAEITDLDNFPKNPANALQALVQYRAQYGSNSDWKVVEVDGKPATEIYGTVPISEDRMFHFRIDAIVQDRNNRYMYVDHKTSGSDNPTYQRQFEMSMQMLAYYHVINCLYPPEEVYGGVVDMTIFRKKGNMHLRIPIRKTMKIMDEWLHIVNSYCEDIERDIETMLEVDREDNPYMKAFRKNDRGCIQYNRTCQYFDFCTAWSNPLQKYDRIVQGFEVDEWNPADREKEANIYLEVK